jgi:hypothetical protein
MARDQLLMGPWAHITVDPALMSRLELEWFDTWLLGRRTPLATTTTHLIGSSTGSSATSFLNGPLVAASN